ncbi:MAG: serine hydrolase domain-containing protein [Myxococcales bacterium]|jgi:CubicO group peptidase (beta-lactamase class C family)
MIDVRPEAAGMSAEALARVDAHLRERYIEPGKIAGALTCVYRKGQLAHLSPLGLADMERQRPMRDDTIVRIYSMSKPLTSIALMMLYERGLVQLTDPVHRWIPEFREPRVYVQGRHPRWVTERAARPMTVHDLLTHQSGLTYGFFERTHVDSGYRKLGLGNLHRYDGTLEEGMKALATLPLEFSPGEHWNYSVATDVVGYLVQAISGRPFEVYLREEILEPLGMVDTDFHVPDDKLERFAACYERGYRKVTRLQDDPEKSAYRTPPKFPSGGGGLVSTVHDYLRFCRMLLGKGQLEGTRIIGRKTLELMTRNHLPGGQDLRSVAIGTYSEDRYAGVGFGLGFSLSLDPAAAQVSGTPGEFAWGGAASTAFWIDPVEDMAVVFLTQLMPSGAFNFRGQLKQIIYGAIAD